MSATQERKRVFCNVDRPDLFQIATATDHQLKMVGWRATDTGKRYMVSLDGEVMPAVTARKKMLKGITLYTFGDRDCYI